MGTRICARCARSLPLEAFSLGRPFCCADCAAGERDLAALPPAAMPSVRPLPSVPSASVGLAEVGPGPCRRRPSLYVLSCFLCGRGTGLDGVLIWERWQPTPAEVKPCRWCGGKLLCDEVHIFSLADRDQTLKELAKNMRVA